MCYEYLRELGEIHQHVVDEVFKCPTCGTTLIYGKSNNECFTIFIDSESEDVPKPFPARTPLGAPKKFDAVTVVCSKTKKDKLSGW